MKKIFRTFLNKKMSGFSLMEVMITMGLVSVTALTMSQMMANMQKSQNFARSNTDFNSLMNLVNSSVMGDATCLNALSGNTVNATVGFENPVRLNMNGTTVGGGSSYGSIKNIQAKLVPLTGPVQSLASTVLSTPTQRTIKPWFVPMSLVVTAQRTGSNYGMSVMSSAAAAGTATKITVSLEAVGPNQMILGCTGLRLKNDTPLNLPVCPLGSSAKTNGIEVSCIPTACPSGTIATGYNSDGGVTCLAYPLCDKIVVSLGNNSNSTVSQTTVAAGGTATSTFTIQSIPIPWTDPVTRRIGGYDCGMTSCPNGTPPLYNNHGIIQGCGTGQLPTACTPIQATFVNAGSVSTLKYNKWACQRAASLNNADSSSSSFCPENCDAKTVDGSPRLGDLFSGTNLMSACTGGRIVKSVTAISKAEDATVNSTDGNFTSPETYICHIKGTSDNPKPTCPNGLTPIKYKVTPECCSSSTSWSNDGDCSFPSGGTTTPGDCRGSKTTSSSTCSGSSGFSDGVPSVPAKTCYKSGTRTCNGPPSGCATCAGGCPCHSTCSVDSSSAEVIQGYYDIYCQ